MTDTPKDVEAVARAICRSSNKNHAALGDFVDRAWPGYADDARAAIKAHTECQDEVNHRDWLIYPDHDRPRLQIPDRERLPKSVDVKYPMTDCWFSYVPELDLNTARARVTELEGLLSEIDHLTFEEFDIGDWRTRLKTVLSAKEKTDEQG